jgi:hypothetical protein
MLESRGIGLLAEAKNAPKRRPAMAPRRSPKRAVPWEPLGASRGRADIYYKANQNKDLFIVFRLAETALKQLK